MGVIGPSNVLLANASHSLLDVHAPAFEKKSEIDFSKSLEGNIMKRGPDHGAAEKMVGDKLEVECAIRIQ